MQPSILSLTFEALGATIVSALIAGLVVGVIAKWIKL